MKTLTKGQTSALAGRSPPTATLAAPQPPKPALWRSVPSWRALNAGLTQLTETQAEFLLNLEREGANRPVFVERLYGRFQKLREQRERKELISANN